MEESTEETKNSIPQDIIFQVLKELPAKSLLRFRCVSKLWCSIVDSPLFINSHRGRSHTRQGGITILMLAQPYPYGPDGFAPNSNEYKVVNICQKYRKGLNGDKETGASQCKILTLGLGTGSMWRDIDSDSDDCLISQLSNFCMSRVCCVNGTIYCWGRVRLVSVSASGNFSPVSSVDGFESGSATQASSSSSAIDFLTLCHRLKTTKRKGWINHGIKGPESIADHMYRMALMALIAGDLPGVNRERLAL
ncbi:HD domain-containing protein C4G3.17 [Camellia lanceoleosa]|uniref:HD domain-containing protein C4G3.17 n=1 Tax=Camellia lanceoleosa TaxID=1840588 RepID=A0ACC0G5Y7_9ERIC|nr:HD domain-containing protein C4G3.17 [Camellia lanceoleosa]